MDMTHVPIPEESAVSAHAPPSPGVSSGTAWIMRTGNYCPAQEIGDFSPEQGSAINALFR